MKMRRVVVLAAALASGIVYADATTSVIELSTRGVTLRFEYVRPDLPTANVVVLAGGDGVLNLHADGSMTGATATCDPLIRNTGALLRLGYALALVEAPSDQRSGLSDTFRTNGEHMGDVLEVIRYLRGRADVPVWVIGTGTAAQSALAVAIGYPSNDILGTIILSNEDSETYSAEGDVSHIRGPILVINHDEGRPSVGQLLSSRLTGASPLEFQVLSGGTDGPCGYETFEGLDPDLLGIIAGFIDRR